MWLELYIFTDTNLKVLLAGLLGAIIGLEREIAGKDPGLRTFTFIAVGSCVFSMISISSAAGVPNAEPSRIAAQILPGIGFIGAGTIFRYSKRIGGLTTAALMWVTASIGMAIGFDRIHLAISTAAIVFIMLFVLGKVRKAISGKSPLYLEIDD